MTERSTLLSYATRADNAAKLSEDAARGEFGATFASPPAWWRLAIYLGILTGCVLGGLILLLITFRELNDLDPLPRFFSLCPGILITALGLTAIPAIRRVRRFAGTPVSIQVRDGIVTVVAPLQWGAHVKHMPVSSIRLIAQHPDEVRLLGMRHYHIVFYPYGFLSIATVVRVVVEHRDYLERAIADLKLAVSVAKANAAEPTLRAISNPGG